MAKRYRFNSGAQHVEELRLAPGVTKEIQQAVADEADSFDEAEYTDENGEKAVAAYIVVKTNAAHVAYNATPVTSGLGYTYAEGEEIILQSTEEIKAFEFINATAVEQVTFTVTFYYRKH